MIFITLFNLVERKCLSGARCTCCESNNECRGILTKDIHTHTNTYFDLPIQFIYCRRFLLRKKVSSDKFNLIAVYASILFSVNFVEFIFLYRINRILLAIIVIDFITYTPGTW